MQAPPKYCCLLLRTYIGTLDSSNVSFEGLASEDGMQSSIGRSSSARELQHQGSSRGVFSQSLVQDKLYILPSSIHEVILVPASQTDNPAELAKIVQEVNLTEVAQAI